MIPLEYDKLYIWATIIMIEHWIIACEVNRKEYKVADYCEHEWNIYITTDMWIYINNKPMCYPWYSLFIKIPRYKRLFTFNTTEWNR